MFLGFGVVERHGWYDTLLAGYAVDSSSSHRPIAVHDAKSGYFLIRDIESDGGDIMLILTRDHAVLNEYGARPPGTPDTVLPIQEKALPSLSTGKGVRIGDSEARVRTLLGSPTKVELSGSRKQFRDCRYLWHNRIDQFGNKTDVEDRYTFKAGRLIEIAFSKNLAQD